MYEKIVDGSFFFLYSALAWMIDVLDVHENLT